MTREEREALAKTITDEIKAKIRAHNLALDNKKTAVYLFSMVCVVDEEINQASIASTSNMGLELLLKHVPEELLALAQSLATKEESV